MKSVPVLEDWSAVFQVRGIIEHNYLIFASVVKLVERQTGAERRENKDRKQGGTWAVSLFRD